MENIEQNKKLIVNITLLLGTRNAVYEFNENSNKNNILLL